MSPALECVVVEPRTCVVLTTTDGDGGTTTSQVDDGKVVSHLPAAIPTVVGVTEAELTKVITSPAFDVSAIEDRTCVVFAG